MARPPLRMPAAVPRRPEWPGRMRLWLVNSLRRPPSVLVPE